MKRVLALLCIIACLAMLCVPAMAASTVTIYVRVPMSWDSVAAYTWEPEDLGTWPGTEMTLNGDGWYEITMPGTHTAVVINNNGGGTQTSDLVIEAGKDVWITVADDNSAVVAYNEEGTDLGSGNSGSSGSSPAEITTAYVAGVGALCGSEWNCADEANKMTEVSDGVFEKTFSNVAVGTYQLKVTDGTWDNSWGGDGPDGNFVLVVDLPGDVLISFDSNTGTISVAGAGLAGSADDIQPTEPEVVEITTAYVAGVGTLCGSEWNCADPANQMTEVSAGVFEITYKNVAAGTYELKVTDGTWDHSWGGDGPEGNYSLTVDAVSDVTISFDVATTTITTSVAAPAATEPTEPATEPTEATEPATEATEATEPADKTDDSEDTAKARTKAIIAIVIALVAIVAVAVVMSLVPGKNRG